MIQKIRQHAWRLIVSDIPLYTLIFFVLSSPCSFLPFLFGIISFFLISLCSLNSPFFRFLVLLTELRLAIRFSPLVDRTT